MSGRTIVNDRTSPDETVSQLVALGRKLRDQVSIYKIRQQLQSNDLDDRLDSALFTMSHLFFSGAVAEDVIIQSLRSDSLPESIGAYSELSCIDEMATLEAWCGSSFGGERNLIGAMSFLVVLMFLFEGFVKLAVERLGKEDVPETASAVRGWVGRNTRVSSSHLSAINFLNEYRNSWHAFGVYKHGKPREKTVVWNDLTLEPDKRIPVPNTWQRLHLLDIIVDTVLEVNRVRHVCSLS